MFLSSADFALHGWLTGELAYGLDFNRVPILCVV